MVFYTVKYQDLKLAKWPHLERNVEKLMPYNDGVEVRLLIGLTCIKAVKPKEIVTCNDNPYTKQTD